MAWQKNHSACIHALLQHEGIDVNCEDNQGRTLLSLTIMNLDFSRVDTRLDDVRYFLEKKADVNKCDLE